MKIIRRIIMIKLVVIMFVVFCVSIIFRNIILKTYIERIFGAETGLPLQIDSLNLGILDRSISIQGLKIYNPERFDDNIMIDVPEIYIDYNLSRIFHKEITIYQMRLNLNEFAVIRNKEGRYNLDLLKPIIDEYDQRKSSIKKAKGWSVPIKHLQLKMGKATFKDYYRQRSRPQMIEFPIELDKGYNLLEDPKEILWLVMYQSLEKTPIARMLEFDLDTIKPTFADTLGILEALGQRRIKKTIGILRNSAERVEGPGEEDSAETNQDN